eukprot:SAG11_NODE_12814_length_683_cov_2.126712_1_plen_141_part_00
MGGMDPLKEALVLVAIYLDEQHIRGPVGDADWDEVRGVVCEVGTIQNRNLRPDNFLAPDSRRVGARDRPTPYLSISPLPAQTRICRVYGGHGLDVGRAAYKPLHIYTVTVEQHLLCDITCYRRARLQQTYKGSSYARSRT